MKWTIAMVNWKMADYLKWQLKILYEFNDHNFRLVIVDNTFELNPEDYKYPNLEIIQGDKPYHSCGLDRVLKDADSEFFLAQDPDFFWLKKNYLKWFEEFLETNVAVGAEYGDFAEGRDIVADAHFPAAFGCAFRLSDIKYLDFGWDGYLPDNGKDVGWKIRKALTDKPFVYFKHTPYSGPKFGNFGWEYHYPIEYRHEDEIVATHMMRGGYAEESVQEPIPERWKTVRNMYGQYFLDKFYLLNE